MKFRIAGFGLVSIALAISTQQASVMKQTDQPPRKLEVVIFGGHPDDPESGAGGLAAILRQQGHEVILAYGTTFRSDRRFFKRPEAEVRQEEASAACEVLGAKAEILPLRPREAGRR